jgi:uncharacterized membrane protein
MKKEQTLISVKLSKDLLDKVKAKAADNEITVSALIRMFLINYVSAPAAKESRQYLAEGLAEDANKAQ